MRRTLALAAFASLLPIAALADEIGAREDIVVEEEQAPVVRESVVTEQKPVTLPPPGWSPQQPIADDAE
jgi:hypothetical protein